MKCEGNFVFKSIEKREGGEFTNERGKSIKYEPTYRVVVDEILNNKIIQRFFKFPCSNTTLFEKFKNLHAYDDIVLAFNVELYQSSVKLVPYDVICEHEESIEE